MMGKMSTNQDTKEIALTIYNGGFGAVKEKRAVHLTEDERELIFADVAQLIETDSLIVAGINVLEFNYDFDLVDRYKLLQKYVDKKVYLKDRKTGEKKSCRLLSAGSGGKAVLEDDTTKEIYMDTEDELVLPSLPSGLIVKPALVWKTDGKPSDHVQVSYLSKGFSWHANYVVELKEEALNIMGWAEIENKSGMTFENAKVKLIAGDVHRIEEELTEKTYMVAESVSAYEPDIKAFFDYHMYTLGQKTTLKDNQSKQICILTGRDVPYQKYYKLGRYEDKADIIVELQNRKEQGLGIPMPEGKIKLYKEDDGDGALEFIGEDQIDHTPKNEAITLSIGKAFDIAFDYQKVDHRKVGGVEYYKYRCVIRNHKEREAEVRFEHYRRGVWEMENSSHEYVKVSAAEIEYRVLVPAEGEVSVEFEYKVDRRLEVNLRNR